MLDAAERDELESVSDSSPTRRGSQSSSNYESAVVVENPLRVEATLSVEDDTLVLELDGEMNVVDYRRE